MHALLASLIRIAQRTGRFTVAEATDIYNGLWRVIGFALFACVAAFIMNAWRGWTTPSLVLAIGFAVAAIYMWAKPLHILVVAGFGGLARRIAADASLRCAVENALATYLGFLKWVLLAGVTFLFITGTVSFKENPQAVLPVLVGLGVIGLFTWAWPTLFVGTWGRKLVYGFAILVVAYSFGSLVPGAVWAKYTGWDPATVKPTATADRLYRLDKTERELDDEKQAKKLESVIDKVKRGEGLTPADKEVIAEARRSQMAKSAASVPKSTAATICPNASAEETRKCIVTNDWSSWIQFANGSRDNGKHMCASLGVQSERRDEHGVTFWRFRVADGTQEVKYRLLPADADCSGNVL